MCHQQEETAMAKQENKAVDAPQKLIGAELFSELVKPETDGYTSNGLPTIDDSDYTEEEISDLQKPAITA